jgi:hypothetical protein
MEPILEKTNLENYKRDVRTNAVLNTDAAAYENYKIKRDASLKQKHLEQQVTDLRNEMTEIKDLLKLLIQRDNNG